MRVNPFKLDFCVLKVVLQYRNISFALSGACISTADEDSGVFSLTGELYCTCRWHLNLYRRWSPNENSSSRDGVASRGVVCLTPAGYHTVSMMHDAITSKTTCLCGMLGISFRCYDSILLKRFCFYLMSCSNWRMEILVVDQYSELCSAICTCTVIFLKQPL